jgi:hypothetical protein
MTSKYYGLFVTVASLSLALASPSLATISVNLGPANFGPAVGNENFNGLPATSSLSPMALSSGGQVLWTYFQPDPGYIDPTPYWWTTVAHDIGLKGPDGHLIAKNDLAIYNNGGGSPLGGTFVSINPGLNTHWFQVDIAGGYRPDPSDLTVQVFTAKGSLSFVGGDYVSPKHFSTFFIEDDDPLDKILGLIISAHGFKGGVDGAIIDNGFWGSSLIHGAIPEPATWAMMIAGFGLVGAALRRRRSAMALA